MLVTEVFKLAVVLSKLVNLTKFEPVRIPNVVALVSKLAVVKFMLVTEVFKLAVVVFKLVIEVFCVVLVVSFEPVYVFNELNIPITWDEPLTTPFVAFIVPLYDVAVDVPIVVIEPLILTEPVKSCVSLLKSPNLFEPLLNKTDAVSLTTVKFVIVKSVIVVPLNWDEPLIIPLPFVS